MIVSREEENRDPGQTPDFQTPPCTEPLSTTVPGTSKKHFKTNARLRNPSDISHHVHPRLCANLGSLKTER